MSLVYLCFDHNHLNVWKKESHILQHAWFSMSLVWRFEFVVEDHTDEWSWTKRVFEVIQTHYIYINDEMQLVSLYMWLEDARKFPCMFSSCGWNSGICRPD